MSHVDAKTTTKRKKLTTWWPWAHRPQTYWSMRTDKVNPCNTALLPYHQPIRELCTSWSKNLRLPSLTLSLKMLPWNPSGSSGLLSMNHLFSLYGPCNKPFSALNSDVLVCLASLCAGHMNLGSKTKWLKSVVSILNSFSSLLNTLSIISYATEVTIFFYSKQFMGNKVIRDIITANLARKHTWYYFINEGSFNKRVKRLVLMYCWYQNLNSELFIMGISFSMLLLQMLWSEIPHSLVLY